MRASFLLLAALCALTFVSVSAQYGYTTHWWTAQVDNMNFANSGQTFQAKYLMNDTYYKPGGPIFFYTGNEGKIGTFANNTGFMFVSRDIAPQFNAMILFAEHRYYGDSLPFGPVDSFTPAGLTHLSVENALADYAIFLTQFKQNNSMPDAQVIAFGGSYGGMLTAWFRKKYPHIVAGGIAGSAPIWWFNNITSDFDAGTYSRTCSEDFRNVENQTCYQNIADSWQMMVDYANKPGGLKNISEALNLCTPLTSINNVSNANDLINTAFPWIANVYSTLPMGDYPYPASFLGSLPANPVDVACRMFTKLNQTIEETLASTLKVVDLFYNYTGALLPSHCHNLATETGIASLGDGVQWPYQTCTELVMPQGQYGLPNDFFYGPSITPLAAWNLAATTAQCQKNDPAQSGFLVTPMPTYVMTVFGGPQDWTDATNIVFSNGDLDPWHLGGVLHNISDTVVAIPVIGGAHHLDLRGANPADPEGVKWARQQEVEWIKRFLANPSPNTVIYVDVPVATPTDDDSDKGMSKRDAVLISVFATFVVCLLVFGIALYCMKSKAQDGLGSQKGNSYNTM